MRPFKYLGWIIWPIENETSGKQTGFNIHEPGDFIHPHATFETIEEAKTAIRREHRTANHPTSVAY
jgi:hypothetical protein